MSHKRNCEPQRFKHPSQQRGSLYIVVIFVLVVMGFLATSLSRVEWSDSDSRTRDVLGTQAWLLAHSVNEYVLTEFYPLTASASVSTVCGGIDNHDTTPSSVVLNAENMLTEFASCRSVDLTCISIGALDESEYFQVTSRITCGSGISEVERIQEIWVRE